MGFFSFYGFGHILLYLAAIIMAMVLLYSMLSTRFLHNYLRNLFGGAWEAQDLSPLPVNIPEATEAQVRLPF